MTKNWIKNSVKIKMNKRVFIVHGWGGFPQKGWFPWLKNKLENRGFIVQIPPMPDTENPNMKPWVNHLAKIVGTPDKNCYFIGHSLGCITILRYLESLKTNQKIGGAVLVAGFAKDLTYEGYKNEIAGFFKTPLS